MAAVKALQHWCRAQCDGYRDVSITNMTTSFRDGLAFCALIHKHRPDLINFDALKKEDVYGNNKLAFQVAEEQLGIPALLDAEDMVALRVPDRLSILTYVSQYYNYFHGRSPIGGMGGIKRPAEGGAEEPAGKKNQPVTAKVFPPARPARENSPPPSTNVPRPAARTHTPQEPASVKAPQSGTLSNKCVSCNKHVHLVQRQLLDGKLYHRSCAKLLSPANSGAPLRDLPANTAASRPAPSPSLGKPTTVAPPTTTTTTITPTPAPRQGPTWLQQKPNSSLSSSVPPTSKLTTVTTPTIPVTTPTISVTTPPTAAATTPAAAPRTSSTAAKTLQSKLKFLQSDTPAARTEEPKPSGGGGAAEAKKGKGEEVTGGHKVMLVVNVGGGGVKKAATISDAGAGRKEEDKTKAAAIISKKVTEENNNNSKPAWTSVALKKTDKPAVVETPKKEPEGVRRKVRLKVDPSLLADLQLPAAGDAPSSGSTPRTKSPDRGGVKPTGSTTAAADSESPSDWRSRLKPITKPAASSQSAPKSNGGVKPPAPSAAVSPPPPKNVQNGQRETGSKTETKIVKTKPDFIPKEDIIKELQDIEDNLNELERRGVELETRLRSSEEEGEDDSVMDDLMVEWFTLIRNKQVAMRRESELVYIGRTQDLEEQQPSVEQELRQLMDKPERLKTPWERRREEELMAKLVEIVNDRNAIVEGLDEDRLREEEEDEELNKMMKTFNVKKDKTKKKSPMAKLFGWGGKKDG